MLLVVLAVGAGLSAIGATRANAQETVPRFSVLRKAFQHGGSYSNPYVDLTAEATVIPPGGGAPRVVPLFWDGGATWKFRFSPDVLGRWTWTVHSRDAGLDGQSGSFRCVASASKGGIRARGNHFEHEDGSPFVWFGDTEWTLYGDDPEERHDRDEVLRYIDRRAAQGFNVVHSNMMSDWASGNSGGAPFESLRDQAINPFYWQEVDRRMARLNKRGIMAGLMLAWSNGIYAWQRFSDDEARTRYARYVTARYAAGNVYFIVAGEWNETGTKEWYQSIAQEIRNSDPQRRMIAIHSTGSVAEFAGESWMSFGDYQQVYASLHDSILRSRRHGKPVVNAEYAYYLLDRDGDGDVDKPNSESLERMRHATYDIVMAGGYVITGFGTTYNGGNQNHGPYDVDKRKNHDWEEDVQHLKALMSSLPLWRLEPNDDLVSGPSINYCLEDVGRLYVVYVRGSDRDSVLSLGGAGATSWLVRRFDPKTGDFTSLPNHSGSGPVILEPPDREDWIFVITRAR